MWGNNNNNGNNNSSNNQYYQNNGQMYNQNGQYNNQYYNNNQYNNQYNQNQNYNNMNYQNYYNNYQPGQNNINNSNPDKKKIDKKTMIIAGVIIVIIVILLFSLFGGKKEEDVVVDNNPYEDGDLRLVGNDTYGYLSIPSDWLKFEDVNGGTGLQYSDRNGEYILTMDAYDTNYESAKSWAESSYNNLKEMGASDLKLTEEQVGYYRAYKVYGYHAIKKIVLVIYCFEAEDNRTHFIGIEGPNVNDESFEIINSFKLVKENN